jgi:hypothetical protein
MKTGVWGYIQTVIKRPAIENRQKILVFFILRRFKVKLMMKTNFYHCPEAEDDELCG